MCLSSAVVADSRVQSVLVTAHSLLFALGDTAVSRLLWLSHSARLPQGRDHRKPHAHFAASPGCRVSGSRASRSHLRRTETTGRTAQTCVRRQRASPDSQVL